jgi:hypothetical protein
MYARVYCRLDTRIFQLVSGILSVVGIPPVPIPIPEEIQLLMYARDQSIS